MKKNSIIAICLFVIVLAFWACNKENSIETPSPAPATGNSNNPTYTGITDFFVKNSVPVQTFTVDGTTGSTFTGLHGTKFTIPAAAFVGGNNQPVTGTVTIKVKEIFVKKEMFFSNVGTTYYGYPLISAGMFSFEASFNGEELKFAPGKKKTVEVPAAVIDANMMAFDGIPDSNGVNWIPRDSIGSSFYHDLTIPYNYVFVDDSTGWSNVDRFYNTPADISITVNTLNNPNPDSTEASVWFTGFNAFWYLDRNSVDHSKFESSHVKPVPVSLIAITIKNNKIYADIKTVSSLTANGIYDLDMHEMTDAQLKSAIMALN